MNGAVRSRAVLNSFWERVLFTPPTFVAWPTWRHTDAAAEFQKILDHRGIVISDPVGALARMQVGRAYMLAGDPAKARAAYQDFLALWKDADLDIPILTRAKAEYAKLQ